MTITMDAATADSVLDSLNEGVFTIDGDWRITHFNAAAEAITGVPREEAIGSPCCEVFRADVCETDCVLRRTMQSGRPVVDVRVHITDPDGRRRPIRVSTALLRNPDGAVVGGVESFRDCSQLEALRKRLEEDYRFEDLIGRSRPMQELFGLLPRVAASGATVLIAGASGSGKELVARAVHNTSPRASGPFVAVNCGALPDQLLESVLFGHKVGAFTGAVADHAGRFAQAAGGSIFLDEIGDISPAAQLRLLRVLQERCVQPLGGSGSEAVDVRVIAASNKDLRAEVAAGRFRQDLYYRLDVITLRLPALVERREDIPLLVEHFIARFNHLQDRHVTGIADDALGLLMDHPFPGNVRELE
ncbi:MAG: sigma-54 interaction domain-containing protein, partial [Planctomycetota bacterium]